MGSDVEGAVKLPSGVCYWRQGSLINSIPTGATKDLALCRFVVCMFLAPLCGTFKFEFKFERMSIGVSVEIWWEQRVQSSRVALQVRDPAFLDILGSSPKLVEFVETSAHEGGVWYPDKNEFYFASVRLTGPDGNARADVSFSS